MMPVSILKHQLLSLTRRFGYDVVRLSSRTPIVKGGNEGISEQIVADTLAFFDRVPYFYGEDVPAPLRIAGAWRDDLLARRQNQIRAIERKDAAALRALLSNMFFNELVAGLKSYGYYEGQQWANPLFVQSVARLQFLTGLPLERIATEPRLPTWGIAAGEKIVTYEDPSHTMQAWSALRLANTHLAQGAVPVVVDLGSGYGGMASKLAGLAEGGIDIWLIDIPANLTTAYAHLAHRFGRERVSLIRTPADIGVAGENETGTARFFLLPSAMVDAFAHQIPHIDVVHNAGSFSEMDHVTIQYYMGALVAGKARWLIETNSNAPVLNTGDHVEVPNSSFPVPGSHRPVSRSLPFDAAASGHRYVTNIYERR